MSFIRAHPRPHHPPLSLFRIILAIHNSGGSSSNNNLQSGDGTEKRSRDLDGIAEHSLPLAVAFTQKNSRSLTLFVAVAIIMMAMMRERRENRAEKMSI
jgi:hypothetical protein